jgi:hypothetical protein
MRQHNSVRQSEIAIIDIGFALKDIQTCSRNVPGNPPSRDFLEAFDRLGMLVID